MSASTVNPRPARVPTAWAARPHGFVLDRLIVGSLSLGVALAAALVLLTALGLLGLGELLPGGTEIEDALMLPSLPYRSGRLVTGFLAALVGLGAVLLLIRRIFPAVPPAGAHHVLSADELGLVIVDKRGISAVVQAAVERIPGVVECSARVLGQGSGPVRMHVRVWAHAGAELKRTGDEARAATKQAVEALVGLEVLDVLVQLQVVPLEKLERIVE